VKTIRNGGLLVLLALFCLLISGNRNPSWAAAAKSQCVACHTSSKKLIETLREIAKTKPQVKKAESKGEG